MSRFYHALQKAEQERIHEKRQSGQSATPVVSIPLPLREDSLIEDEAKERFRAFDEVQQILLDRNSVENHLVSILDLASFGAEQYRALCHLLEQRRASTGLSVLAVSSPAAGDGKTTTAINLAGALAQTSENRVLLVDLDLRKPSLSTYIGLKPSSARKGVTDIVGDPDLHFEQVAYVVSQIQLTILPSGRTSSSPYDDLKSVRLSEMLEMARENYNYIILDTPPLIPFPDCRLIEKLVDGFLVIVKADKTPRKLVEEALQVIDQQKLVGVVFNGDDHPVFGYSSYYGYDAYGRTGKKRGLLNRVARGIGYLFGGKQSL
jgi:protein-tyrosine kinase